MKILHLTHSYTLSEFLIDDIYHISQSKGFFQLLSSYIRFWKYFTRNTYDILHIHSIENETFGMYAFIARCKGLKVVLTVHDQKRYTYVYIIKRLISSFFISHTMCTSKYDMSMLRTYHISKKSERSLVYQGVDEKKENDMYKKDFCRSFIYKKIGISFTKNIRMVGVIVKDNACSGIEHVIDAAYLADLYKNLTNTIFVILSKGKIPEYIYTQIHEQKVEGILFVVDLVENPEQYMKAFDIIISPRLTVGDMNMLLQATYNRIACIATNVGDTKEIEKLLAVSLVPIESAKYLTEALMYVIEHSKHILPKSKKDILIFPHKFTKDFEKSMTEEVYKNSIKKP